MTVKSHPPHATAGSRRIVQVIIDADTRLVVASGRPAPGDKADAHVWRESDLPAVAAGTTVIADGAYLGTGLIVPHRRRAGRPLLRGQEDDNAEHRRGGGPCRAQLRPDEELEDPPRLPPKGRRPPPRRPGRRHHAQPRPGRVKQQVSCHSTLSATDLLQHPGLGLPSSVGCTPVAGRTGAWQRSEEGVGSLQVPPCSPGTWRTAAGGRHLKACHGGGRKGRNVQETR
ncbi:transposase [Streptomyces sp. NPDC040750]|uniref:transposase n=1 Tax=Streptomyces sp. NPDC040750 TaxID=3154491 RepID=UPI0033E5FD5C